jgi:filamentous hemagglutinin family protein
MQLPPCRPCPSFIVMSTLLMSPVMALPGWARDSILVAQLVPDDSLGVESSVVTPGVPISGDLADAITGGAIRDTNLFHSFAEFNVLENQRVYFANPIGIENILSRVTGGNLSNIDGLLGVDGAANLFLMNPNGIRPVVKYRSKSLKASLGEHSQGFCRQEAESLYWRAFRGFSGLIHNNSIIFGPNARLDVQGSFTATTADSIGFADGSEFSATPMTNELLTVSVPLGVQFNAQPQGDITQQGDLTVGVGETLTLFGDTVLHSGALTAAGGTVQILGNQVGLVDGAVVDVSAAAGGGTALIGGDYRGQGVVPTAEQTFVGEGSRIIADALQTDDGGQVVVWADDTTQFYGTASARGGTSGGNGGFVEVSGAQALDFRGEVDATAPLGEVGTLLLDPTDITVQTVGANTVDTNLVFADVPANAVIDPVTINAAAANVVLEATNSITFAEAVNIVNAGVGLTAQTQTGNITVNAPITTNGGDVDLTAGQAVLITNGPITTQGGNIRLNSLNGEITIPALGVDIVTLDSRNGNNDAGDIEATATGDIEVEGGLSSSSGPPFSLFSFDGPFNDTAGNGGTITLSSGGNIDISANLNSFSSSINLISFGTAANGGAITLSAAEDIIVSANLNSSSTANGDPEFGGAIALTADGNIDISGVLDARSLGGFGPPVGRGGGSITLTAGEAINVEGLNKLRSSRHFKPLNLGPGGANCYFLQEEILYLLVLLIQLLLGGGKQWRGWGYISNIRSRNNLFRLTRFFLAGFCYLIIREMVGFDHCFSSGRH